MTDQQVTIREVDMPEGKTLSIFLGAIELKAEVQAKEPNVATFTSLNGRPIDDDLVCDPSLIVAEAELRKAGYTFFCVQLKDGEPVEYPSERSLSVLPMQSENMALLWEADRYDGPISGLVENTQTAEIFWFNWCQDTGHSNQGRIYSLRSIPKVEHGLIRNTLERVNKLQFEQRLLEIAAQWPISPKQKSTLRTLDQIQSDISKVEEPLQVDKWRCLNIAAWMPECMEELAAIRLIYRTHEESAELEKWEVAVAQALSREKFEDLNALFEARPKSLTDEDLFIVRKADSSGAERIVACDHRGQEPNSEFILTAKHQINDVTRFAVNPSESDES